MRKLAIALLVLFALLPGISYADDRPLLVVAEMIEINAAPAEVWNLVKRFDGLVNWHPAFSGSPLVKGKDGQLGAVRALTLKDGPTFTEELIAFNEQGMTYTYEIVESPLPIDHYQASLTVKANAAGGSTVTWIGTFKRKNPRDNVPEAESDAGTMKLISGAYQAGLQTVKKMLQK
jgi:polyketide cyclase/dehydrase/lipid transport protein